MTSEANSSGPIDETSPRLSGHSSPTSVDDELKVLVVFHYVVAGLAALFAFFPIFHLIIGIAMILAPAEIPAETRQEWNGDIPPGAKFFPMIIGMFFVLISGGMMLFGWVLALMTFLAGRFLSARKHYKFCLVMAGVLCIFFPFGTILGIFTIIFLTRAPAKEQFRKTRIATAQ